MYIEQALQLFEKAAKLLWSSLIATAHGLLFFLFLIAVGQLTPAISNILGGEWSEPVQACLLIFGVYSLYLIVKCVLKIFSKLKLINTEAQINLEIIDGHRLRKGLVLGICLGIVAQVGIILFLESIGYGQHDSTLGILTICGLINSALVAISEEVSFRGYLFQISSRIANAQVGLVLSAFCFMLGHVSTYTNQFNVSSSLAFIPAFLGGVMFVYAFQIYGSLWLAIGLHFAWDFFTGIISPLIQPQVPGWIHMFVYTAAIVVVILILAEWKKVQLQSSERFGVIPKPADKIAD